MSLITENPNGPLQTPRGFLLPSWIGWFKSVFLLCYSVQDSGSTSIRPTDNLWVGRRYFDTTLGKPIWVKSVNPTVWVDATGAAV